MNSSSSSSTITNSSSFIIYTFYLFYGIVLQADFPKSRVELAKKLALIRIYPDALIILVERNDSRPYERSVRRDIDEDGRRVLEKGILKGIYGNISLMTWPLNSQDYFDGI